MHFNKGEKVLFLSELGSGTVLGTSTIGYLVEDENGFTRDYPANELVRIHGSNYGIKEEEIVSISEEDETFTYARHHVRKGQLTGRRKEVEMWEIDLHIEEITESHKGLSNQDILDKQMRELRSFYQKARSKFVRKLVIIHGVGEGVLKDEVRYFLDGKEGVEFYDADFREYGKGATAVEITYNLT